MTSEQITHKTLADLVGVSETTIKSYRRKFPGCIPVASQGKPIRFKTEAKQVVLKIYEYFSLGMCVDDVRSHLEAEFSFIVPDHDKEAQDLEAEPVSFPGISHGLSNMAKSLVDVVGRQKATLERIERIEHVLGQLGVGSLDGVEEANKQQKEIKRKNQVEMQERLDRLDKTTQDLASSVSSVAEGFRLFLEQQARVNQYTLLHDDRPNYSEQTASAGGEEKSIEETAPVQMGQDERTQVKDQKLLIEPDRALFSYPLVAKRDDGRYVSAGGRNRGRFCLNDLKAMLVYGFPVVSQFSMQWHPQSGNWWLLLEQSHEPGAALHLLLVTLTTQHGTVLEIAQAVFNGQPIAPAETSLILDAFVEQFTSG